MSEAQVRRIVKGDRRTQPPQLTLRAFGVETRLKKVKATGAPTLWYRLDQEKFLAALHACMEQSDTEHCAGSILHGDEDEIAPTSGIHSEQCAPSFLDPETSTPDQQAEDQVHHNPAPHPDDDLDLFNSYVKRFGKLKAPVVAALRAERERLGAERVGEVLERCAQTGRSWAYVQKALANEVSPPPEGIPQRSCSGSTALNGAEGAELAPLPPTPRLEVSERVFTPWQHPFTTGATVQEAWAAAFQQMEFSSAVRRRPGCARPSSSITRPTRGRLWWSPAAATPVRCSSTASIAA